MQLHALIGLSCDVWLGLLSQFAENINFRLCVTCTDTIFWTPKQLQWIMPLFNKVIQQLTPQTISSILCLQGKYKSSNIWTSHSALRVCGRPVELATLNIIGEPTGSDKWHLSDKMRCLQSTLLHTRNIWLGGSRIPQLSDECYDPRIRASMFCYVKGIYESGMFEFVLRTRILARYSYTE
jgi:hypothetical protein